MADYKVSDTDLTSVANAIRIKGGTILPLEFPDGFVDAVENIATGGSTLTTKTIRENGTYNASSDNADGYSSVTVNVTDTRFLIGTFTGQSSEKGTAKRITLPYSGTGYPIAMLIFPTYGAYKSGTTFYNAIQKFASAAYCMVKADTTTAPTYSDATEKNNALACNFYKNSDSSSTVYSRIFYMDVFESLTVRMLPGVGKP